MGDTLLLFGGSFDPPHQGHLALLKAAIARTRPAEVRVLPAFRSPLKSPSRAPARERLALLRLALRDGLGAPQRRGLVIDGYEIGVGREVCTYESLRRLKEERPGADILFLAGSDSLETFPLWRRAAEVRRSARFLVGARPGFERRGGEGLPPMDFLPGSFPGISSTRIRLDLLLGRDARALLAAPVLDRILRRGLYGTGLRRFLSKKLAPGRWRHSACVAETASRLAGRWGLDPEKAALSGIVHDCGRMMDPAGLARYARRRRLDIPHLEDILSRNPGLLHAYVSEDLCRRSLGVADPEVLSAVRKHTLGDPAMSPFDRMFFVADASSADRDFPEADGIRDAAERGLAEAFRETVLVKLSWVIRKRAWMHPHGPWLWNQALEP